MYMQDMKNNLIYKIVNFVKDELPFGGVKNEEGTPYSFEDLLERTYLAIVESNPLYMTRANGLRKEIEPIVEEVANYKREGYLAERLVGDFLEYADKDNISIMPSDVVFAERRSQIYHPRNVKEAYLPRGENLYVATAIYLGLLEKFSERQHQLLVSNGFISPDKKPEKPFFIIRMDPSNRKMRFVYPSTYHYKVGDNKDVMEELSRFIEYHEESQ